MSEVLVIDELVNRLVASLGIKTFTPYFGRDRFFLGAEGERVPFEAGLKSIYTRQIYRIPMDDVYVRVGELIFLDDRLREHIPRQLARELRNRIIYLHRFDTALADEGLMRFSGLTIHALTYTALFGKTVLDLGSADGVLSLVAKRKGDRKIISVDNDSDMKEKLENHIIANFMRRSGFEFIASDIRSHDLLIKLPLEKIQVVVANLGPEYGSSHLYAIDMLDHMPNANNFICGGYVDDNKDRYRPQEAFDLLSKKGFKVKKKIVEADQKPRLSFIAERMY